MVTEEDLENVTFICANKSDAVFETWKKRQIWKFGNLGKRPGKDSTRDTSVGTTWVHNMSKTKLSEAERKVLSPVFCDAKVECIGVCSPYRSSHAVLECSTLED